MWKIIFIGKPRVFHIYVSFPQGIHSGQEILWPGAAIPFWHWVRWTYAAPSPPPKGELSELSDRNSIIMSVSVIISHHKISSYCFIYQVMCHRYNSRENISYIHNSIYIYIYIYIKKVYIYISISIHPCFLQLLPLKHLISDPVHPRRTASWWSPNFRWSFLRRWSFKKCLGNPWWTLGNMLLMGI